MSGLPGGRGSDRGFFFRHLLFTLLLRCPLRLRCVAGPLFFVFFFPRSLEQSILLTRGVLRRICWEEGKEVEEGEEEEDQKKMCDDDGGGVRLILVLMVVFVEEEVPRGWMMVTPFASSSSRSR